MSIHGGVAPASRDRSFIGSIALTCVALVACTTTSSSRPVVAGDGTSLEASLVLGAGDVIEVKVYREPELDGVYRVNSAGALEFPLIGKVALEGKNSEDVASEIRTRLADGFLKDPQVSVFVREYNSKKIHVLGQVTRAGTFPYEPRMSIIQAITNAGGFTKLASTNAVKVTRVTPQGEQSFDLPVGDIGSGKAPNFELWPGDIVFVPEALF